MKPFDIVLVSSWLIGYPVLVFCFMVVRSYHVKKPLGMQTLLSKTTILAASLLPILTLIWMLIYASMKFLSPMPDWAAVVLQLTASVTCCTFLLVMILLVFIKYMSMYHNVIVSALDEDKILRKTKITLTVLSCLFVGFDYGFVSNVRHGIGFSIARHGLSGVDLSSTRIEMMLIVLIPVLIMAAAGLQIRIEYENFVRGEQGGVLQSLVISMLQTRSQEVPTGNPDNLPGQGGESESVLQQFGYKLSSIRVILLLGIAFFVIIVTLNSQYIDILILLLFANHNIAIPILVVWTHPGMRQLAVMKFSFCNKYNIYVY